MSKRLEIACAFIKSLANSSLARRKFLLRHATTAELKGLCEICMNLKRGRIPLDSNTFKSFKRQRKTITALANKRVSLKKKKELVNQKGGFIGKLAIFALPLLTDIIARQIQKRR